MQLNITGLIEINNERKTMTSEGTKTTKMTTIRPTTATITRR